MIYFIQDGEDGPIKIGFSNEVEKRVHALVTSSHKNLKILFAMDGDISKEKELHDLFDFAHKKGEWFWPVKSLVAFIESCNLLSQVRQSLNTIPTNDIQLSKLLEFATSAKDDFVPGVLPPTEATVKRYYKKQVDELRILELHRAGASLHRISHDVYGSTGGKQYTDIRAILEKYNNPEQ
jgi:hypothetical protein